MDTKVSNFNSSPSAPSSSSTVDSILNSIPQNSAEDYSIITLIPCEYDPIDGYGSPSEDSIDSSEIIDSSDDELETVKIKVFYKNNEKIIKTS